MDSLDSLENPKSPDGLSSNQTFFFFFWRSPTGFLICWEYNPNIELSWALKRAQQGAQAEAQIKADLDLTPEPQRRAGSAHLGFKVQAEPSLTQTRAWLGYHA